MTIKYLITRDGRDYVMDSVPDWAVDNDDYEVTELVAKKSVEVEPLNLPNTDDIQERIQLMNCLLYTSPSPRDLSTSRMPSSA